MATEDIVAKRQRHARAAHKLASDQERLSNSTGTRLDRIFEMQAPLFAGPEQPLERFLLVRRVNDEDFSNPRHHQRGQRVIDHRLVVDRDQLLRYGSRYRIETSARATR